MNASVKSRQILPKIDVTNANTPSRNGANTPYSPVTPIAPSIISTTSPRNTIATAKKPKKKYSSQATLARKGYMPIKRLSKTLQGSIWKVSANNGKQYIVKVANKSLAAQSKAQWKGQTLATYENILKEIKILRHLTTQNPPNALIKYIDCFADKYNYFLVMENGGNSLFDFIKTCHEYIAKGMIDMTEWHSFCKLAMQQMIAVIDWLHNTMHCCHLDLSLENFTVQNMHSAVVMDGRRKKIIFSKDFQIKLIDFGVSETFRAEKNGLCQFQYDRYVGKVHYQSPEICNREAVFDAASADCWSLGVCLFMMFFGCHPCGSASRKDDCFRYIISGRLIKLLEERKLIPYVSSEILDLLNRIFCYEKYRFTIGQIRQHCFFE